MRASEGASGTYSFFHAYDVRGQWPAELGPRQAYSLGVGIAKGFPGRFVVGRDVRSASRSMERHFVRGLLAAGALVERLGTVSTPMVAFACRRRRATGCVVSPSHNPLGFAGLKCFTPQGRNFAGEWSRARQFFRLVSTIMTVPALPPISGLTELGDWKGDYIGHVTNGVDGRGWKLVVDSRGGSTSKIAPDAFAAIGASCHQINSGFSPTFHGRSPEPSEGDIGELGRAVRDKGGDLGFTFDGDGDRLLVVAASGKPVPPEVIAGLLHDELAPRGSPLVASLDASSRCEQFWRVSRSRVGARYVVETMRQRGATVGFEPSGHFYLRRFGLDSDGLLCAIRLIGALGSRNLDRITREFGPIHRRATNLVFHQDSQLQLAWKRLRSGEFGSVRPALDGVYLDVAAGRYLVRRSNTQPALRFLAEGKDGAQIERLDRLLKGITDELVSGLQVRPIG